MTALVPVYLRNIYNDDPFFNNYKIIYSIYNNDFNTPFRSTFADKLRFDGIDGENLKLVKKPDFVNVSKLAIKYSDGIIIGSEDINKDLLQSTLKQSINLYFHIRTNRNMLMPIMIFMTRYYHNPKLYYRLKSVLSHNSANSFTAALFCCWFLLLPVKKILPIIGSDLLPATDFVNILSTDTIGVAAYSYYTDSIISNNRSYSYLGAIYDPYFGKTETDFVGQLRMFGANGTRDFRPMAAVEGHLLSILFTFTFLLPVLKELSIQLLSGKLKYSKSMKR